MLSYAMGHIYTYFTYQFRKERECNSSFDWGKYYEKNGEIILPVSVQAHHSFVDGLHIGQFVDKLQKFFDEY